MKLAIDRSKAKSVRPLKASLRHGKRVTGPTTRTIHERERDHPMIAGLLLKGVSYVNIAKALKDEGRPYPVSKDTVARDVKVIYERWRLMAADAIDLAKGKQLARIAELEERCYAALDRLEQGTYSETQSASKASMEVAKEGKATPAAVKTGKSRRTMLADTTSAWLATLRFCLAERSKILGLYAPLRIDKTGDGDIHIGDNNTTVALQVNIASPDGVLQSYDFPVEEIDTDTDGEAALRLA